MRPMYRQNQQLGGGMDPSSINTPSTSFTILSWEGGSFELEVGRLKGSFVISKLVRDVRRFAEFARIPDNAAAAI
jgi:hypothetical protein